MGILKGHLSSKQMTMAELEHNIMLYLYQNVIQKAITLYANSEY